MTRAAVLAFAALVACRPAGATTTTTTPTTGGTTQFAPPPTQDEDTTARALDCNAVPCTELQKEIEQQCKQIATVRLGTVGRYTVLSVQTDPTSIVYTSFRYVYDRKGALVGRSVFVNEYSRHDKEGIVPRGEVVREHDPCPPGHREPTPQG